MSGSPSAESAALDHVRLVEVDRGRQEQEAGPPVDWVERDRLLVADQVGNEPDEKPEQSHGRSIPGTPDRGITDPHRGPIPQVPTSPILMRIYSPNRI